MNLRPSGYEPDELPGCSTPRQVRDQACCADKQRPNNHGTKVTKLVKIHETGRPGNDLLSRALRQSTIGATGFHGRVRNGIGWDTCAITTWSSRHMYLCASISRRANATLYLSKAKLRRHPKLEYKLANRGALAFAFTHG